MKYILILIITFTSIFAKSKESCYSVQLSSFVPSKVKTYNFEAQKYPENCQLIEFSNINAVRCGCFEKYNEVKKEAKSIRKSYKGAMIVTTYKYRFKAMPSKPKPKSKPKAKLVVPVVIVEEVPKIVEEVPEIVEEISLEKVPEVESNSFTFLKDIVFQGNFDITAQSYIKAPEGKNPDNLTASANLELEYIKDDLKIKTKIKAQQDHYDLNIEDDNKETGRSFIRIDELYARYDFEDDQIMFGKNIRFWGALEVRNITDNFNSDELRADPFYKDKLGSWNTSYSHFTENGEFSIIVKLYEQSREIADYPYVYYYFPSSVQTPLGDTPLRYDNKLITQDGDTRPSIYLKYSASTESEYPIDYSLIFENGYDSQRYYSKILNPASNIVTTQENAYLVNKFLTYNTMVVNSTLFKLEAVYADVLDNDEISDYIHLGLGAEHTLPQFYKDSDLSLIMEYYSYSTLESGKRSDLELFELFQNDIFFGARYTLNDSQDTALVGGAILDIDYDEQVYYIEYETRLAEIIKINFDYRYIKPSKNNATAFHLMGTHERLSLELGYYF